MNWEYFGIASNFITITVLILDFVRYVKLQERLDDQTERANALAAQRDALQAALDAAQKRGDETAAALAKSTAEQIALRRTISELGQYGGGPQRVQALETEIDTLKSAFDGLRDKTGWHGVADELPDILVNVLVVTSFGETKPSMRYGDGSWLAVEEPRTVERWCHIPEHNARGEQ